MGVAAGVYMYDVVVKKVHVRYLICWWVLVIVAKRLDASRCHLVRRYRPRPRRLCVRCGPSYPQKNGHTHSTQFLAHVYCGQTAGWIKMPLGTEVNAGSGDVVLDGVAAPPIRGTAPSFRFMSNV